MKSASARHFTLNQRTISCVRSPARRASTRFDVLVLDVKSTLAGPVRRLAARE
jgi:hypothetical protein